MSDNRTPEQIEAELARLRRSMTATVDDLVDQLDPKVNAKRAWEDVKDQARKSGKKAQETIDVAKEGDPEAQKIIAVYGGIALVVGLLVLRRIFK